MHTIVLVLHVCFSLALVGLILIQHGKGADAGAAFGSGASGTVFGSKGSGNFLSRATGILAFLFFVTSIVLVWITTNTSRDDWSIEASEAVESVVPDLESAPQEVAPEKNVTESIPE